MRFNRQANLIIALAMFWAIAAVLLLEPFYGLVIALALALLALLISVMARRFDLERLREMADVLARLDEFRNVINRSGALVFVWWFKPDKWPVEYVSENVADIVGYTAGDFISGRVIWAKIIHPDDVPRLEKEAAQYLEQGVRKWSQEYRLLTKSGEVRWFRADNLALEDSAGKIIRIQAIIHDITERKRSEERLERVNRCLLSSEPDFNANINRITALCGELLDGAYALYTRLEFGMLYALGQWHTPPDFNPKDFPAGHICYDMIRNDTGKPRFIPDLLDTRYAGMDPNVRRYGLRSYLGCVVHSGAETFGVLSVFFRHPFNPTENDRNLLGILASAIRIEENRRKAVQELRESEEKLRTLVANVPGAVCRCVNDPNWTMVFISEAIVALSGYPASDFIFNTVRSYASIVHADDRRPFYRAVQESIKRKEPFVFEYRICRADGTIKWVYERGEGIYTPGGNVMWIDGVIMDITELKTAKQDLQTMNEELRSINEKLETSNDELQITRYHLEKTVKELEYAGQAKNRFLASMSHELRTPLHAIMGFTDFLLEDNTLNPGQKRDLDRISANTQHLFYLIDEILDLSRIEAGKIKLAKELADIAPLIGEALAAFKPEADKKRIQFVNRIQSPLPGVLIDRDRIMQVLDNLVSNAVKYTAEGGKITLSAEQKKDVLEISVADTGIGIPPQYLDRIFERFESVPNISIPDAGGTGLGLTICRELLSLHSGRIWVESEAGKGSKFTFALPVCTERQNAE